MILSELSLLRDSMGLRSKEEILLSAYLVQQKVYEKTFTREIKRPEMSGSLIISRYNRRNQRYHQYDDYFARQDIMRNTEKNPIEKTLTIYIAKRRDRRDLFILDV